MLKLCPYVTMRFILQSGQVMFEILLESNKKIQFVITPQIGLHKYKSNFFRLAELKSGILSKAVYLK